MSRPAAILIAGPTASGKSHHALELAASHDGIIVNADSMQVYRELRVLSARPSAADEAAIPHRLYGHVPAATRYSVGQWLIDAAAVLDEARDLGRVPIFVGGTGLYFTALLDGLASIPPIPPALRARLLAETEGVDPAALHARLTTDDPGTAAAIRPSDRARILRALEVLAATGRPLAEWQRGPGSAPLVDRAAAMRILLDPPRPWLHGRIAVRAEHMVGAGAIDEARSLGALRLSPDLPAMKAIGVRQFLDLDAGKLTLAEAVAALKTETRRYAKRQVTWFRHRMDDWRRMDPAERM